MARGDAELAAVLRRFLSSDEYSWHRGGELTLDGKLYDLSEDEQQAVEEAMNG